MNSASTAATEPAVANPTSSSTVVASDAENMQNQPLHVSAKRRAIENILKDRGTQQASAIDREINTYLDWPTDCFADDALLFWKEKQKEFPNLKRLAKDAICLFQLLVSLLRACFQPLGTLQTAEGLR